MKYILLCFFFISGSVINAQDLIHWYTWEEGITKAEEGRKKFVIDLYTDWCTWCKRMDMVTFQNPDIADYVNEHFIPIKFNAEQKDEIIFNGQSYNFVKGGKMGYHELAGMLTNGNLDYPTVIFLDESHNVIQALSGFLDAETFHPVLRYFAQDLHKTISWSAYINNYKREVKDATTKAKQKNHTRLVKGN